MIRNDMDFKRGTFRVRGDVVRGISGFILATRQSVLNFLEMRWTG